MKLRIVRKRYKLLYFVVWLAAGYLLARFIYPHWPDVVRLVVAQIVWVAFVVVAVRSFRGKAEAVIPPRPWWRMTGGVPSGFLLGSLWAISAAVSVLDLFHAGPSLTTVVDPPADTVVTAVVWLLLAVLYINSAVRLRKLLRDEPEVRREVVTTAPPLKGLD
jgi:hypothetical protein